MGDMAKANRSRGPLHIDSINDRAGSQLTSTSLIMAVKDPDILWADFIGKKKRKTSKKKKSRLPRGKASSIQTLSTDELFLLESSFDINLGPNAFLAIRTQRARNSGEITKKKRKVVKKNSTRIKVEKVTSTSRRPLKKRLVKKRVPVRSKKVVEAKQILKAALSKRVKSKPTKIKAVLPQRKKAVKKTSTAAAAAAPSITASAVPQINKKNVKATRVVITALPKRVKSKQTKTITVDRRKASAVEAVLPKRKRAPKKKVTIKKKKVVKKAVLVALEPLSSSSKEETLPTISKIDAASNQEHEKDIIAPTGRNGKSSTMPGFLDRTHTRGHQSFRDGLKIAQKANVNSNRRNVATHMKKVLTSKSETKKRVKANSEAMYQSSGTVPDSLIAYANEFHQVERITPKEEAELGTKTQEAMKLQIVFDELKDKMGRDPTDDEWCKASGMIDVNEIELVIDEGTAAKDILVTSNLRLVQGVVNLYIRNGLGTEYNAGDLMQEGTMALIRAAEKFEPTRGFRFSTYAMYWIRAAVKRSQILQSRIINVPQRHHESHKKITKVEAELKKELGRKPTEKELAASVGITPVQMERSLTAMAQKCFSLDSELENTNNPNKGDLNKATMHNILAAQYDNAEYTQLQSKFMKEDLTCTLNRYLTAHEVDLLLLRYGLMDERTLPFGFSGPLTIAEVSRLVGLKPDKVRRMINKCLRQLRHLIAHEWEDFESFLQKDLRN